MAANVVYDFFASLGDVKSFAAARRGVELAVDRECVRFDFIQPDVLRVKISVGGVFDAAPTFAVAQDEFGAPKFSLRATAQRITLASEALVVRIDRRPFHFDVFRRDGSVVLKSVRGWCYRFLNGRWVVRRRGRADDAYLGLGEKSGPINRNGRRLMMWNTDILAPNADGVPRNQEGQIPEENPTSDRYDPYYMSINLCYRLPAERPDLASASFMDNGYRLHYDLSKGRQMEIRGEGGQLTEYIFGGPSLARILRRYTELTGRMQAPPLWALGHHQCRWYDYTQKQWERLGETYRRKRLPCDVLWLDIGYMDGYRVFTWDKQRFPAVRKGLARLEKKGFRAITIVDPGVKAEAGYSVFDEGRDRNLFCKTESGDLYIGRVWPGRTAFPDFVKEETRRWWGRLNAEHVDGGLAGIWNDMNEPATGDIAPYEMRFDRDGANHTHMRYHNQYAMLMAMGTHEGLKAARPDRRPFVLSRAGFAGIQRYAANWTGDNCARWEHLAMSIPMNCGLGLSGQPFVGSDIGGFLRDSEEELLVRWYQYGTFQPFMRNHACMGTVDHYPWSFGARAERIIRAAIELRYRLVPYLYTCFMQSARTGEPIQRPLVYDYQHDPAARDNSTEFLFGPHLLVAPVVRKGERTRQLYLPGDRWLDLRDGRAFEGGRTVTVDAALETCPVFVRAGAVIPTAAVVQTTMRYAPREIVLNVYIPPSDGVTESLLHEDDGLTDKHREGAYLRTRIRVVRKGKRLTVEGAVEGQGYAEFRRTRFRVRFFGVRVRERVIANRGEDFSLSVMM